MCIRDRYSGVIKKTEYTPAAIVKIRARHTISFQLASIRYIKSIKSMVLFLLLGACIVGTLSDVLVRRFCLSAMFILRLVHVVINIVAAQKKSRKPSCAFYLLFFLCGSLSGARLLAHHSKQSDSFFNRLHDFRIQFYLNADVYKRQPYAQALF